MPLSFEPQADCAVPPENNTPLVVFGTGKPLRQFIFSKDLASLIIWALDNYKDASPLILSVGEEDEISIGDVVKLVVDAMEFKGPVVFDTTRSDGQYKKTASNAKLTKLLGEKYAFTPMKDGLATTVKWFVDNYETARK